MASGALKYNPSTLNILTAVVSGTISDTTNGFIDTGLDSTKYVLLAVHNYLEANISYRISCLASGNYRIQCVSAVNGAVIKSGSYRAWIHYIPRSCITF